MPSIFYAKVDSDNVCTTVCEYAQSLDVVPDNYMSIASMDMNLIGQNWNGSSWEAIRETAEIAKEWRNAELERTDDVVAILDHPTRDSILAYRILLRNWPSTSDFPATKPVIGG